MPQIPVYNQQSVPRGTTAIPQMRDIGRDALIAGASVDRATDAWARKLDADAAAVAGTELAKAQQYFDQRLTERQKTAQSGAPDFTKSFIEEFREYQKETLKRMPTETARGYLGQRFQALEQELFGAALSFEANEGVRHRVRLNEQGNDAARLTVRNHPERFMELLAERRAAIDASGVMPEDRDRLYDQATQGLAADALVGMAKKDPEAVLLSLYAEPGKSGNPAIEALTPEGRDQMVRFVQGQFESLVRAQEAQARLLEQQREETYRQTELVFTQAFLEGRLSNGDLIRAVQVDAIDPTLARTLRSEMDSEADGGGQTNDAMLFAVSTNLLGMSEDDIRQAPGISFRDKIGLIEKHRQQSSGWPSTPEAREAMQRIDRDLGILPGTPVAMLSQDTLRQRGRALTEFYTRVSAMPADQRQAGAIGVAEQVIKDVLVTQAQAEARQAQQRLEQLRKRNVEDMGASEREVHDRQVKQLEEIVRRGQ